jgi:hypothetical protein
LAKYCPKKPLQEENMDSINAAGRRYQGTYDTANNVCSNLGCIVITGVALAALYYSVEIYEMFFKPQYS